MILQTSVSTVLVESSSEAVKLNYGSWLVIFDIRVIKKQKEFTSFSCLKMCVLQILNFFAHFLLRSLQNSTISVPAIRLQFFRNRLQIFPMFFFSFRSQCSHFSDLFSNCPPQKVMQGNLQHAWNRRNSHFREYYCCDRSKRKTIPTFCSICLISVSC